MSHDHTGQNPLDGWDTQANSRKIHRPTQLLLGQGGVIVSSYTLNNGRSETPEKLTIIPGQHTSNYIFTWQGALPADHTYPGLGGVMVTSPNQLTSPTVAPAGKCR